MAQRYVSQLDVTTDVQETSVTESDLLSGSHPIKVTAYSAETVLPASAAGAGNNYAVELFIGEREKIGQGTFGYRNMRKLFSFIQIRHCFSLV